VTREQHEGAGEVREIFFGRLVRKGLLRHAFCLAEYDMITVQIEQGSARRLIKMFDVKKRRYFGNTSMEAEVSLLMANQTLVRRYGYISSSHDIPYPRHTTGFAREVNL
jgi:tRNA (guanine10-N2)-methyltransferase